MTDMPDDCHDGDFDFDQPLDAGQGANASDPGDRKSDTVIDPIDLLDPSLRSAGDRLAEIVRKSSDYGVAPQMISNLLSMKLCLFQEREWGDALDPDAQRPVALTAPDRPGLDAAFEMVWEFRKELSKLFAATTKSESSMRRSTQDFLTVLLQVLESMHNEDFE